MNTKEILTIIALAALGLCLLCSLAKMAMKKGDKGKKHCDKVCGAFVFLAIVLLAVSQLLGEGTEKYGGEGCQIMGGSNGLCHTVDGACGGHGEPVCPSNKLACDCEPSGCPKTCCEYKGIVHKKDIYEQQVINKAGRVTPAAQKTWTDNCNPP